ncbi:selenocysteine-specific translation elongation factor [Slackia piriformis]|uniref:selenocysteine-specific translation elongation factor n=1 Tax=Slackia piriformis TaxID=626934 RepID=UPI0026DAF997|nr:selenocysteine-specific translation elongation factor [Slackia piriformis]MDO5023250.1 selenocysteine-specific translation elongation factor [Slackia piriformis]
MKRSELAHFVLGTAGHIDHGKSTLIEALTGTNPDRLAEEQKRGITIELGFAQLDLGDGLTIGVVDVPGHERFVRQMIAGASGVDMALLCIAADDGVMPQTVEHLAVLELLGVRHCVIALTKSDLVDEEWIAFLEEEIEERLASSPFSDAPIVAVSARSGSGLEELRETIRNVAKSIRRKQDLQCARLPVDRSFSIKGSGTVVTGTLWSGTVCPADKLQAYPGEEIFRIRTVQRHGQEVDRAFAGDRVALNIAHAEKSQLPRGIILAEPGSLHMSDRFDASFSYIGTQDAKEPFCTGQRVRIAHGTTEVFGRVLLMQGEEQVAPREGSLAQIRLDEPLPLSRGDRFVVRSMSPVGVIGGGRVLHCSPRRRTILPPVEEKLIAALLENDRAKATEIALAMQTRPASALEIAQTSGLTEAETRECLAAFESHSNILRFECAPPRYIGRAALQRRVAAIENALLAFHAQNPTQPGMSSEMLRNTADPRSDKESFKALLVHLASADAVILANGLVSHPKAQASAKRIESQAAASLVDIVRKSGSAPSTLTDLMEKTALETSLFYRAIGILEKQGQAQRVGEYCFSAETLEQLEGAVRSHIETHGPATAAELKDAMGTSRKYAIPLLEHFDSKRVTVRNQDLRSLA